MVVYKFTSIICPNNHVKLSVKNKLQRAHQLSTKATISATLFDFRPYNFDINGSFADIPPRPYQLLATFADIDDDSKKVIN